MLKYRAVIVLLLLIVAVTSCPIYAQRQSRSSGLVATVDFTAAVLLHPEMANYSPHRQAFRRADAPQSNIASRQREHAARLEELENRASRLKADITRQHREYEREIARLSTNYMESIAQTVATATRGVRTERYNVRRSEAELRHESRLKLLSDQYAGVSRELNLLQATDVDKGYSSPDQTRRIFNSIVEEVRQIVEHVARQRGIEVVLNSGYRRGLRRLHEQDSSPVRVPSSALYRNVLTSFYYEMDDVEDQRYRDEHISAYYYRLSNMTSRWLRYQNEILSPFNVQLLENDIVFGGTDITYDVLFTMLTRNNVNEHVAEAIIKGAMD